MIESAKVASGTVRLFYPFFPHGPFYIVGVLGHGASLHARAVPPKTSLPPEDPSRAKMDFFLMPRDRGAASRDNKSPPSPNPHLTVRFSPVAPRPSLFSFSVHLIRGMTCRSYAPPRNDLPPLTR